MACGNVLTKKDVSENLFETKDAATAHFKRYVNSRQETDAKKRAEIEQKLKIHNFDPIIVKPCQNYQLMSW